MMLNASKSTIGEIIAEREDECDNLFARSTYGRRRSTSVEKMRSMQSGAIELFDNSKISANVKVVKVKTHKVYQAKQKSPVREKKVSQPRKQRSPPKQRISPVKVRKLTVMNETLSKQKFTKVTGSPATSTYTPQYRMSPR